MSDFALQFIPMLDPSTLTAKERGEIARQGQYPPPSTRALGRTTKADQRALDNMGIQYETGMLDQFGSGLNTGLAWFAGAPVDGPTWVANKVTEGINTVTGADIPPIERPIGGSERLIEGMRDETPLISQMPPQTVGQRYARRTGEEIGFGVPTALATGGTPALTGQVATRQPGRYLTASTAGDMASAVAGQTAREIAPDSHLTDFVASILGGTAGGTAAASLTRPRGNAAPTRTRESLQAETDAAYAATRGAELTPDAQQALTDRLWARMELEGGDALSHRKAHNQVSRIAKNPRPDIYGVEQGLRQISKYVARNADEAPMGMSLMDEIDDYLRSLTPDDIATGPLRNGPDPQEAVAALHKGRGLAHQGFKYDEVANAQEMAHIAADQGQNKVAATQREIGNLYRNQVDARKSHTAGGYTPEEMAALRRVARPSAGQRALRTVGQMSPTSSSIPSMLTGGMGVSGATAALASGNPWLAATAVPPIVGAAANTVAKRVQGKNVQGILDAILENTPKRQKGISDEARAAIINQLFFNPGPR